MNTNLARLSPPDLWRTFTRQPWSFWLICFYFFLEYVRPQSIWPALDVLPWGKLTLLAAPVVAVLEGKLKLSVPLGGLMLTYAFVVLLSVVGAYQPSYVMLRPELFLNWLIVFFLVVNVVDTREKFFLFMLLFLLWNFKMSQHAMRSWAGVGFAFRNWGVVGAPGWFHNSGEFGIQMTMFFPLSVYFAMHCWKEVGTLKRFLLVLMPVSCVIGTIGTASRGAYLGLAAGALVFLLQSRRVKVAAVVVGLFLGAALLVPSQQWDRWSTAGEDDTSQARLTYWRHGIEIMNRHPVLGVGYENWLPYYRDHYAERDRFGGAQEPHNIFIEAGAELGYSGLLAFLAMILGTFVFNRRTRRIAGRLGADGDFLEKMAYGLDAALVGFLVSGFFVTVLYYPYFWVNLSMTGALYVTARKRLRRSATVRKPGSLVRPSSRRAPVRAG